MKYLSLLTVIALSISCSANNEQQTETLANPFIHTAYFWLKPGLSESEKESFMVACQKLKEIETVRAFYTGRPANTTRAVIENSYDFAVVFHFENLEDQAYYQAHPLHLEMIENHQDKWVRVMVTDIEH